MMNLQHGNLSELANERYIRNRFKYMLKELKYKKGNLLVIGSGDGSFERLLRETYSQLSITSLDINDAFREKLSSLSDTVIIDDFLVHTFDGTFDYIESNDVIEHIEDTDNFLIKARGLLRDDGLFYLQTPNLASWHGRLCLLFGFTPEALEVSNVKFYFGKPWPFRDDETIHHIRVFTYRALKEMCEFYGFDVIRAVGVDPRVPAVFKFIPGIAGSVCLKLRKSVKT
jgi:SAM-dependent methyltransferase